MPGPSPAELAAVPLFQAVDPDHLPSIAAWLEVEQFPAGHRLTREGAAGYAFFILRDGRALVTVGDDDVSTLGPGDYFGELSLLGEGRRTATVTATTPVTVWSMFGTRFRELQQSEPEVAATLEAAFVTRSP